MERKPGIVFLLVMLLFSTCLLGLMTRGEQNADNSSETEKIKKQQILKMEAEKQLLWELRQIQREEVEMPGTDPELRSKAEMEIRAKIRMLQSGNCVMDQSRAQARKAARNKKDHSSSSYGGSISGRVTDYSGVGIQNIMVEVFGGEYWEHYYFYGYTDASGNYTISNIYQGSVSVFFNRNDQNYVSETYPYYVAVISGSNTPDINAQLATGGQISGRVTDISGVGIQNIGIITYHPDVKSYNNEYGTSDASGNYTVSGLPAGNIKVEFWDSNYVGNHLSEWYNDKSSLETADPVSVIAGIVTPNINAQLATGGQISGRVTNTSGIGIEKIQVRASDHNGVEVGHWYLTDTNGYYTITCLPSCSVKIKFYNYYSLPNYRSEWYNDKSNFAAADPVTVIAGNVTANIDAQLTPGGKISGRVIDTSGVGIKNIEVFAFDLDNNQVEAGGRYTDSDGNYMVSLLPAGNLKVFFGNQNRKEFLSEWYNDKSSFMMADQVTVADGSTTANINSILATAGKISGQVSDAFGVGIKDIAVVIYKPENKDKSIEHGFSDASGNYTILGLPSGSYKVSFQHQKYIWEWYNDKQDFDQADPVAVTAGSTTANINAQLATTIPPITVYAPNGGESWNNGSIRNITWTSVGTIGNIAIDYSVNNGGSWIHIVNTANDSSYAWTIPCTPSDQCLVRISDAAYPAISDGSDAVFSITNTPPQVQIVSPENGASVYGVVTVKANATDDTGITRVEFYVDGGLKGQATAAQTAAKQLRLASASFKISKKRLLNAADPTPEIKVSSVNSQYTFTWDTTDASLGTHVLRVVAYDEAGAMGADDVTVQVLKVNLDLQAERREIRAFSILRHYGQIQFTVDNPGIPVAQYRIMRRKGSADFALLRTISPSELQNNQFQMQDKYLEKDTAYTYWIEVYYESGSLAGISDEKTI